MEKRDIIKMAKHVFKQGRGKSRRSLLSAERDWYVGLIVFFVILLTGGYVSGMSFSKYQQIDIGTSNADLQIPQFNENTIKKVITKYQMRAEEFNSLVGAGNESAGGSAATTTDVQVSDPTEEEQSQSRGLPTSISAQ